MARKSPVATHKIVLMRLLLFFIVIFGVVVLIKKVAIQQCVEHVDHSPTHTHTQLKVVQEGNEIKIPSNVGISDNCMHPLHTHDATGLIHMEYPMPLPFFLGDFFNVMGIKFDDTQIGSIRTFDGYKIEVFKNGKPVRMLYRWILLKDLDKIEIRVDKK